MVQVLRKDEGHDKSRCFQKGILIKSGSTFPPTETETSRIRETRIPALNADIFFLPVFDFLLRQHAPEISPI